jgi:hypothetical protein
MDEQAKARDMMLEEYLPFVLHNISMHTMIEMEGCRVSRRFLATRLRAHKPSAIVARKAGSKARPSAD